LLSIFLRDVKGEEQEQDGNQIEVNLDVNQSQQLVEDENDFVGAGPLLEKYTHQSGETIFIVNLRVYILLASLRSCVPNNQQFFSYLFSNQLFQGLIAYRRV
jgi:hypothetical protein